MEKKFKLEVAHSNKRERTITIKETWFKDGSSTFYRSYPLSADDFRYYTNYATGSDLSNFLKYESYYKARR